MGSGLIIRIDGRITIIPCVALALIIQEGGKVGIDISIIPTVILPTHARAGLDRRGRDNRQINKSQKLERLRVRPGGKSVQIRAGFKGAIPIPIAGFGATHPTLDSDHRHLPFMFDYIPNCGQYKFPARGHGQSHRHFTDRQLYP